MEDLTYISNLEAQLSGESASDQESTLPQIRGDDTTHFSLDREEAGDSTLEQRSPSGSALFANFGIPGLLGEYGLPFFSTGATDNGWPPVEDLMNGSDWMNPNPDCFSDTPEHQDMRPLRLASSEVSPSHSVTNNTQVTIKPAERARHLFEIGLPPALIDELIEIYFEKVHHFLPLFHKPRFLETYVLNQKVGDKRYENASLETSLILHGILALSARFSSSPHFNGTLPVQRGEAFGERAKAVYGEALRTLREPTLQYLQGCVLLGFYLYSSEPDSQGWMIIGMCSRIAYDLGLDKVDANRRDQNLCSKEWSMREELRRAWWCVWELDTFASAIACRPATIDRMKMHVQLPVSDQAWFADNPIESAIIDPDPLSAWHTLRNCPNQDERAWFLLTNFLLLVAHDLGQQRKPDPQLIEDIESAVACYALLLPPRFHLNSGSIFFDSEHFRNSNWIISTNIMLQGCRTFIHFLSDSTSSDACSPSTNHLLAPLAAGAQFGERKKDYRPYADQVFRTIRIWSPEYIPYHTPLIGCLILGPAAINLRVAKDLSKSAKADKNCFGIQGELLKLTLTRISEFWKIGSILLDIANSVAEHDSRPILEE